MSQHEAVDRLLSCIGQGGAIAWPASLDQDEDVAAVRAAIDFHGVAAVLAARIGDPVDWPAVLIEQIRQTAAAQAFWEDSHRAVLRRLLAELASVGVESAIMKGTVLAYSAYPDPALRRRGDSDVLIRRTDLGKARKALGKCGFRRVEQGVFQESWQNDGAADFVHLVDLHWQVTNMPALRHVLAVDECLVQAQPLPKLTEGARGTGKVHTLLHCLLNQYLHRSFGYYVGTNKIFQDNRLVWQMDNQLLTKSLSSAEWSQFAQLATARGMASVCLELLDQTARNFHLGIPAEARRQLMQAAQSSWATEYVERHGLLRRWQADWRACPDLASKAALLRHRLFPSRDQLMERFPDGHEVPTVLLYLRRFIEAPTRVIGRSNRP